MPKIKFTDATLRGLKSPTAQTDYWDSSFSHGSFGLRVSKTGKKVFAVRYNMNGKRRRFILGPYPAISLTDAKKQALCLIGDITQGKDPQGAREEHKRAETVDDIFSLSFEYRRGRISEGWLERSIKMYEREIQPQIGHIKAKDARKSDFIPILQKVAADHPTQAQRLRSVCLAAFRHAVKIDLLEFNPLEGIPDYGNTKRGERYLSADEIRLYLEAVDMVPSVEQCYFKLLIYLGMRPGELSRLKWEYVEEDRINIPSTAQKNGRPLAIPLVGALKTEILQLRILTGRTPFLFPAPDETKARLSFNKHFQRIRKVVARSPWTLRDVRRTVETHLRELGASSDTVAAILYHKTSGLQRIYDQSQRLEAKRASLMMWTEWLHKENEMESHGISNPLAVNQSVVARGPSKEGLIGQLKNNQSRSRCAIQ